MTKEKDTLVNNITSEDIQSSQYSKQSKPIWIPLESNPDVSLLVFITTIPYEYVLTIMLFQGFKQGNF